MIGRFGVESLGSFSVVVLRLASIGLFMIPLFFLLLHD